jgi:diguanylate cyclase (GGDEF)-like protein
MNLKKWQKVIDELDFAYQPIVNINSGKVIGFEALLRGTDKTKFKTIDGFFDKAYDEKVLHFVEVELRKKAIKKFLKYKSPYDFKLFVNLDNRLINSKKFEKGQTKEFLESLNVKNPFIVFEISEKHKISALDDFQNLFLHYTKQDYEIAIDDYGTGCSSLNLLYYTEPKYVKIDKFFVKNIHKNIKKQIFFKKILEVSHLLGYLVIAEGVETQEEFLFCKEAGVDMIQGYFIERPNTNLKSLPDFYKLPLSKRINAESIIMNNIEEYPSVNHKTTFSETFKLLKDYSFIVVVNDENMPLGVLEDKKLKEYIYSPYGNTLLCNKKICDKQEFLTKCFTININESIENFLNIFSLNENFSAVIIKENNQYKGVLTAQKLLEIIHKKQLLEARDQNPLTKLPGNSSINNYIQKCIESGKKFAFIYFDFNNFKPYNDIYGFRNGDRAILLFSEILKLYSNKDFMIGHIGGDDFFLSIPLKNRKIEDVINLVEKIIDKFSHDIISFYKKEDIDRGYIKAKDRDGELKRFDFLSVSAAVLEINFAVSKFKNDYSNILAVLKKEAKKSKNHYSVASLL